MFAVYDDSGIAPDWHWIVLAVASVVWPMFGSEVVTTVVSYDNLNACGSVAVVGRACRWHVD